MPFSSRQKLIGLREQLDAGLDDISVWKKGIAVVSIPLLVLMFTLILMAWHENVSRQAQDRVRHSLQVKAQLYQVQAALTDSEMAVRGYLLWKDVSYLTPYEEAQTKLPQALTQLSNLLKDNGEQTSAVTALRFTSKQHSDTLRQMLSDMVAARRKDNPVTQASYRSMLQIRQILREMETTEATLLHNRILQYDRVLTRLNILLMALFVLAILCGISASYIVSAGILSRVNKLEHYARRVSRNQPAEWTDSGQDEIGMLGRSVQVMTNNLLAREDALRLTREELQKSNTRLTAQLRETKAVVEELETFSYSVSHDLRAPLRHVAGFADLMQKNSQDFSQKNQRYLGIIVSSVKQMGTLIDELLAFSRMGRTSLNSEAIDLNEIMADVLTNLSSELQDRNIEWKVDPLSTVSGDRVMLRLVFQNLIDNALKYSRERDPAIISVRAVEAEDTEQVEIVVSDNGVGFDMQYAEKLFGVFQRLHNAEEYEGTGVGLATVRRILKRHGGSVEASGELGKGASFRIRLPAFASESRTN